MEYLEWSNEIRIVSSLGQKLAEVMFYCSKIWWNSETDQKGQNYDIFSVKFETTPWTQPHC